MHGACRQPTSVSRLEPCPTAIPTGACRTIQAAQQRGLLTACGVDVGARTVSSISAAKSWSRNLCGSVISRQFTSLRELAPSAGTQHVRHASCQGFRSGNRHPALLQLQGQLRCYAAAGSSSRAAAGAASAAAAGSRRTAQRASVDQKSSSQALYLASPSTRATLPHPPSSPLGIDVAQAVPWQVGQTSSACRRWQ